MSESESLAIWNEFIGIQPEIQNEHLFPFDILPEDITFSGLTEFDNETTTLIRDMFNLPGEDICYLVHDSNFAIKMDWGFFLKNWIKFTFKLVALLIIPSNSNFIYLREDRFVGVENRYQYFHHFSDVFLNGSLVLSPELKREKEIAEMLSQSFNLKSVVEWHPTESIGYFIDQEHITRIRVPEIYVIPQEILKLKYLTQFNDHHFRPEEFYPLSHGEKYVLLLLMQSCQELYFERAGKTLKRLVLSDKKDVGKFPSLNVFKDLEELTIRSCNLQIFPEEICSMSKLKKLALMYNKLNSIPHAIKQLKNLEYLDIRERYLTQFPEGITVLPKIKSLNLTFLPELKNSIGKLENLEKLCINISQIKKLPLGIGELQNLRRLDLSDNQILEELLPEVGKLAQLEFLNLSKSKFKTLPEEIGNLQNVREIRIWDSDLQYLPTSMGKMQNLKILSIIGVKVSEIPKELDAIPNLLVQGYNELIKPHPNLWKTRCDYLQRR